MAAPTPRELGYRMPAEWERHAATWLSWPHNRETWPGRFEPIPAVWEKLVGELCRQERVNILAGSGPVWQDAAARVGHLPGVTLFDIPTNDCWMRDHGPTFLLGPRGAPPAVVDWNYNAWGGKYPPFDLDDQVPRLLADRLGRRRFSPGIVLEGGSIEVDGQGTVLTTEQCLLNPNRNPHLTRADIEPFLADYLNAPHVIWLGEGIAGDDTDGHIDDLARFAGPRTIVTVLEDDPRDPNYGPLQENLARLRAVRDAQGRPYEIVTLPMPRPRDNDGQQMPLSYANYYVANGLVIAPQFGDPADAQALDTLTRLYSERRVAGHFALDLVWGLGAYHCITQQEPATE